MALSSRGIPDDERRILDITLRALEPFKAIRDTMPLQYVTAFLHVARDEGHNIAWYADKVGISQSLMSRHMADLGDVDRYHNEGFGLIEQFNDPYDKRFRLLRLSPKGWGIANQIVRALS
jgi:DNA-binding MarR family transcriptional regulator